MATSTAWHNVDSHLQMSYTMYCIPVYCLSQEDPLLGPFVYVGAVSWTL